MKTKRMNNGTEGNTNINKGWEQKELKRFRKSARKVVSRESQGESLNLVAKGNGV